MSKPQILIGTPHTGTIEAKRQHSISSASVSGNIEVLFGDFQCSELVWGHNLIAAAAINANVDFVAILHSDVVPQLGWLDQMLTDLGSADIIHAPCRIKNTSGVTSTALAFSEDIWECNRRLTMRELAELPPVFGQYAVDKFRAKLLLPNTGCLLMRCGDWMRTSWRGFHAENRLRLDIDGWFAEKVSEDWCLGFDAFALGLEVLGTTNVRTHHYGKTKFSTSGQLSIGWETDHDYEFQELWESVKQREGWLTREEARAMFDEVKRSKGDIVEVGTFKGRSTEVLCSVGRRVVSIDPEPDAADLVDRYNVLFLRDRIQQVKLPHYLTRPCGLVYIDGDHSRAGEDWELLRPHVERGARVLFHDYAIHDGIKHAVDTAQGLQKDRIVGSLWIGVAV